MPISPTTTPAPAPRLLWSTETGTLVSAQEDAAPGEAQTLPTPRPGDAPGGGPGDGGRTPSSSPFGGLWMIALLGVIFWFLILGPERKARKQRDSMLEALKKGDKIVTTGGLHAEVVEIGNDTVTLKSGDTRLKFSRAAVGQVVGADDAKS
ncbi:MAG: preprotein translocase subunit YajC [Planctomycetota bacterium]